MTVATYCNTIWSVAIVIWAEEFILIRAFLWTQFTTWTPCLANCATACCLGNRFTNLLATTSASGLLLYFHVAAWLPAIWQHALHYEKLAT